jgi:lysophospholipase L1-like esterase
VSTRRALSLLAALPLLGVTCQQSAPRRPLPPPAPVPALPAEGTVLFLGDSITWQNLFPMIIESAARRRMPARRRRFVNRGVRGDTAGRALARLERDVAPFDPALVVVLLGMNDGGYRGLHPGRLRRYRRDMDRLVTWLQERTRARVVLVTSTAVLPGSPGLERYNEMLGAMARELVGLGRRRGVPVIDLFTYFEDKLARAAQADPPVALMADPVHPGPAGHLLIAEYLLRFLDPRPPPAPPLAAAQEARLRTGERVELIHDQQNVFVPPAARSAWSLLAPRRRIGSRPLHLPGLARPLRLVVGGRVVATLSPAALARGVDLDCIESAPWVAAARQDSDRLWQRWRHDYALWDPKGLGKRAFRAVAEGGAGGPPPSPEGSRQRLEQLDRELARRAWRPIPFQLELSQPER